MTNSFIAIRGSFLDKTDDIFKAFGYLDTNRDKQIDDWKEFHQYLSDNYFELANKEIALRGIWTSNGWTIISDPEMVDDTEEETLLKLSQVLHSDIITFTIHTTSNFFGFTLYDYDRVKREIFVSDGEIIDNLFEPLEEEKDLNINENIFSGDILKLAERFGIDLEGKNKVTYLVKQLAYNDDMKAELEQFKKQNNQTNHSKKAWWKFW